MVDIPISHLDLLIKPLYGVFTTLMSDGQPQCSLVWVDFDGGSIKINTTTERRKGKNMLLNKHVNLFVIDPTDSTRWIEIRADVELIFEGAIEHLNHITKIYSPGKRYYGDIYPESKRSEETRVICLLHPVKINLDAIHK